MKYTAQEIARIIESSVAGPDDISITAVSTDTRTITYGKGVLFFAITTMNRSGLTYLSEAAAKGVQLVVADDLPSHITDGVTVLLVDDVVGALQALAAHHRRQFDIPVVGITGSYGKTIVKEWLSTILSVSHSVCKSPQSYNSQIGVPLSVLQLEDYHTAAVFEVGISQVGEMTALANVVRPTHGIFTTIGPAHEAGFTDLKSKVKEKLHLFVGCQKVVCNKSHTLIRDSLQQGLSNVDIITWSLSDASDYTIEVTLPSIKIIRHDYTTELATQLSSEVLVENLLHASVLALELGVAASHVRAAVAGIGSIPMRLETSTGRRGSLLINDTYSADIQSLRLALEFQAAFASSRPRMLILSDIDGSHGPWVEQAQHLIDEFEIQSLITIGSDSERLIADQRRHFKSTSELLEKLEELHFDGYAILVKGARRYELERVYQRLESLSHNARLEIDLAAIRHNLGVYQQRADCAIMVVIKASAYGTGSVEVARLLQRRGVAYLAVAIVDEALALRQANITLPILVLNPDLDRLSTCSEYDIDIELHAVDQLQTISRFLARHPSRRLRVHVMLDTGMKRLGFEAQEVPIVRDWLIETDRVDLISVCSHLVSSESIDFDAFTQQQLDSFDHLCHQLPKAKYYHILNSSGIARHHSSKYNMARLGLGLYGIDSSGTLTTALQPVHTLSAKVLQVKHLKAGDSVGYGRAFIANEDMTICTVNVGYADGLMRSAGSSGFAFRYGAHLLPVVGRICMDLTMCAVPDGVSIGVADTVTVFGPEHPIELLAKASDTIPYEILSRIAPRVKRVFHN